MQNLELVAEYCAKWFKENNVDIPNTAKEWTKSRSGVSVPPGHTYEALRNKGISVGDLLECILPGYVNRVKNTKVTVDSILLNAGLTFICRSGKETIHFECGCCGEEKSALLSTIKRWVSKGQKYCSDCRSASGKIKTLEYYQKFLAEEFKILELKGNDFVIQHQACGTKFLRARNYIAGTQRVNPELICCPTCDNLNGFIFNRKDGFLSLVEKEIIEHLDSEFPEVKYEREVFYRNILDTARDFRLDVWLPEFRIGIEITSHGNNLRKYSERLQEKLDLAEQQGIKIYVVKSKKQLEDIVRPLLKNKEELVTKTPQHNS